ncbi:MAG: tetratricopeptide repeat protein, partial [Nitrosospira sp.]
KKVDGPSLDALLQPYRNQSGNRSLVNPPLTEALAAAEQALGRPVQAAEWYLRSLTTRPRDFLWTLSLADNMEWAGCSANANHVRFSALNMFASPRFNQTEVQHHERLAEYFLGTKDSRVPGNADDLKKGQQLRERWGFTKPLDNARHFALSRERERLQLPVWEAFATAVRNNDSLVVSAQLSAISNHLQRQAGAPSSEDMLPLSIDDVDRTKRWLAGEVVPGQSSLNDELDVCRQTLAKIREVQGTSKPDQEQANP